MERPVFLIFNEYPSFCEKLLHLMKLLDIPVQTVKSKSEMVALLKEKRYDVFIWLTKEDKNLPLDIEKKLEKSGFLFWGVFGPLKQNSKKFDIIWPLQLCENEIAFRVFMEDLYQLAAKMKRQKEMASLVLHDLRSPLQNLNSYVELLSQNVFGELNDGQQKIIHNILLQSELAEELLQEISDILRFKRQTFELPREKADIVQILNEVIRSLWVMADRQNIKLQTTISPNLPEVWINVTAIKRVLFNLILNAIKFSKKNGVIRIQARLLTKKPQAILVQISDYGPGIPEKHLHKIFNKFYRLDQPQELFKGSGLGLYIAKTLIEAHNGRISVYNNREGGATFYFTLPLQSE